MSNRSKICPYKMKKYFRQTAPHTSDLRDHFQRLPTFASRSVQTHLKGKYKLSYLGSDGRRSLRFGEIDPKICQYF